MRFNSLVFVEFSLIFFLGWALIGRRKPAAHWYLVLASWVFYGFETWWFVPILVATGTIDWALALAMSKWPKHKKLFLIVSCASNLGVLGALKYAGFFADSLNSLLKLQISLPHVLLPIGISFYTFQSLSYVIDVYRGDTAPTTKWVEFLAIVSLFAHIVSGPIVRVSKILPQIQALAKPCKEDLWAGLDLICTGFFKKIVLADRLAVCVNNVYGEARPTALAAILGTASFAFEIYFDFGGYTDIARGIARWLGMDFGINFNHPYSAIGMADFWSRWHISLTSWVRDYLYIPLGGNRRGELTTHRNIWICMLLSGLWHGANWTFVAWGTLHAIYLSVEKLTRWPERISSTRGGRIIGLVATFGLVLIGWVFFRSESIHRAFGILGAMVHPTAKLRDLLGYNLTAVCVLTASIAYEAMIYLTRREMLKFKPFSGNVLAIRNGIMLGLCIIAPATPRAFIYFQF